ncbi:isochorismate synthase MenF [Actinokineospora guangxiensis]|uniref:isochorismate synthase n=1 Tax=Actinokineospora guangxiensis TaxID=1490288 RepID=A0ABW0ELI5_9PSEU
MLTGYRRGGFRFASPAGVLAADGVVERIGALGAVPAALDAGALVVGLIPFDPAAACALTVPETVRWGAPLAELPAAARPVRARWVRQEGDPAAYRDGVRSALAALASDEVSKVVLARELALTADGPLDPGAVLGALAARDRDGYVFAAPTGRGDLVGATPELLLSRRGDLVVSNPLAGSRPRSADPALDRATAAELLASAKDRREHAYVVSAIADALSPLCATIDVPAEPELIATEAMWHLSTRVTATSEATALDLALALHPTPAVCGTPADAARELITRTETFDRGFYSGLVGWCDSAGDGEWAVALRCGEIAGDTARLFAGAGIVAGSDPDAELAETSAKFRTFLSALGAEENA